MTARPKTPEEFDENPILDPDFFARARPAAPGDAARLRVALERIVEVHDEGQTVDDAIFEACKALEANS